MWSYAYKSLEENENTKYKAQYTVAKIATIRLFFSL